MFTKNFFFLAIALTTTVILSGCGKGEGGGRPCLGIHCPDNGPNRIPQNGDILACAAEATPQTINPASSTRPLASELTTLKVTATGGSGRYAIDGYVNEFGGTTTLSGGFYNGTPNAIVINREVKVRDLVTSETAQCGFSVTVRAGGISGGPGGLPLTASCSITGPDAPQIGKDYNFGIAVQDVAMPYEFSTFNMDDGRAFGINRIDDHNGVTVPVQFSRTGANAPKVNIIKNGVQIASCTKTFNVRGIPAIKVSQSPAFSMMGSSIALNVVPSHFISEPSYTFVAEQNNVTIAQSGRTASVSSSIAQTVKVTVTATQGTDAASYVAYLYFGSPVAEDLNCHIEAFKTAYDTYEFKVKASQTGEALTVDEFLPGEGGAIEAGSSYKVKYATPGYKLVSAKAHATASAARICNFADPIYYVFNVETPANGLACMLVTSPNPVGAGGKAIATVMPIANYGAVAIDSLSTSGGLVTSSPSDLQREVLYSTQGSYAVQAVIRELATGRSAVCSTTQVVANPDSIPATCSARFMQNGQVVTQARAREALDLYVGSSLGQGFVKFFAGAETYTAPTAGATSFPTVSSVPVRYKNAGLVNATAYVANQAGSKFGSCSIPMVITPGLACSIKATSMQNLDIQTTLNPDAGGSYPGPVVNVPVEIEAQNAKAGLAHELKVNGSVKTTASTTTLQFGEHGKHLIQGKVIDSKDPIGATCESYVQVNRRQHVLIGRGSDGTRVYDQAVVKFHNGSTKAVQVKFRVLTRKIDMASGGLGFLFNGRNTDTTLVFTVTPGQTWITPAFKRDRSKQTNFDFTIEVDGDQPNTNGLLTATVEAKIGGALRVYQLGGM